MTVVNHFSSTDSSSEMITPHWNSTNANSAVLSLDNKVNSFKHFLLQNNTDRFIFLSAFSASNQFMLVC